MRERMFQEFRDAKEKELSEVTRIRQDLEMRLQSISDSQETAIGMGEPTTSLRGNTTGVFISHSVYLQVHVHVLISRTYLLL